MPGVGFRSFMSARSNRSSNLFGPDDGGTLHALQVEAVNADGARIAFATAGKRASVAGSTFTHGARVFLARDGGPGVSLCESVLDALAVVGSPWGAVDGEAVIAGAGTSGLQAAAVASWPGPVTIWTHGDGPGLRAVKTPTPPQGLDWADVAQQDHDERAAIQEQDGLVSLYRSPRRLKLAKPLLGLHSSFDRSMILLQDVVQVLDRPMSAAAMQRISQRLADR